MKVELGRLLAKSLNNFVDCLLKSSASLFVDCWHPPDDVRIRCSGMHPIGPSPKKVNFRAPNEYSS